MATPFQLGRLEELLHETIPLASAMGVQVRAFDDEGLRLEAPLRENGNPHGTIFGGSAAALAILAGWSLVYLRLMELGLDPALVIQRSTVDFVAPAPGDVTAVAAQPDEQAWARFLRTFRRRGKARISVSIHLRMGDREVARATAWYVALRDEKVA